MKTLSVLLPLAGAALAFVPALVIYSQLFGLVGALTQIPMLEPATSGNQHSKAQEVFTSEL